tara:strand:+ start:1307 stop:1711 length:405 start_codon:yes stop_codon:yes gene_type:complete
MSTINATTVQATNVQDTAGANSSTTAQLTSGRAKAWVNFDGTGTVGSPRDSFNVTGITDNGTGQYTVTIATDMSNANYSVIAGGGMDATSTSNQPLQGANVNNIAVGSFMIHCGSNTYAYDDWAIVTATVFGDQ